VPTVRPFISTRDLCLQPTESSPGPKSTSKIRTVCRYLATGIVIALVVFAITVWYLHSHSDTRHSVFAYVCSHGHKWFPPDFHHRRCEHLQHAAGVVLEIGAGTGVNFQCYSQNSAITEWIGIEPNEHMLPFLHSAIANASFSFPTRISTAFAQNMSEIRTGSVDTVVSTHVLCSVGADVHSVMVEISRVLKAGGRFLFLEHVASTAWLTSYAQSLVEPVWSILGDGCTFRTTWNDVHEAVERKYFASANYLNFSASGLPQIIAPHIIGTARLRSC